MRRELFAAGCGAGVGAALPDLVAVADRAAVDAADVDAPGVEAALDVGTALEEAELCRTAPPELHPTASAATAASAAPPARAGTRRRVTQGRYPAQTPV